LATPSWRAIDGNRGLDMTKQLEIDRAIKNSRRNADEPAPPLQPLASLKIKIGSVQYAGATATPKGDIPSWRVTFILDAEHLLPTPLTVLTIGATNMIEARQQAIVILRRIALALLDAAKQFHE
jgi:hypothetical protein